MGCHYILREALEPITTVADLNKRRSDAKGQTLASHIVTNHGWNSLEETVQMIQNVKDGNYRNIHYGLSADETLLAYAVKMNDGKYLHIHMTSD
ncbi:MAG: hypothetical protein LBP31_03315 [Holosporales bacterium]|jgi:hypothetical protein|nr:hypothetical protein [Holosporales bacterium]